MSENTALVPPQLIPKNTRETLRLAVDEYKGRQLLSCRIWFPSRDGGGELRPSREGWAIAVEKLPQVIAALQQIETAARAAGILGDSP